MTTQNVFGRSVIVPLTNKSGGSVAAGDVVILDSSNNDAFTTTTSAAVTTPIGIAQQTIANNAVGLVLIEGYASLVNVNASVTRLHYGTTHTVAKQATDAGASRTTGTFCCFLSSGTTPDALVFPVDQTAPGAATVQGTRVRKSTSQNHASSGSFVAVTWDTEDVDDGGWHDNVTNNTRITVTNAGWVHVIARVEFAGNASGIRAIRVLRNGTEIDRVGDAGANVVQTWEVNTEYKASASDYFEVEAFQSSGGTIALDTNGLSRFTVKQVR